MMGRKGHNTGRKRGQRRGNKRVVGSNPGERKRLLMFNGLFSKKNVKKSKKNGQTGGKRRLITRICSTLFIISVAYFAGKTLIMQWADEYPVSRVKIIGFLNHVSPEDIKKALQKEPAANFFRVNLNKIKGNLELLPWVAEVNVKKQWPDTLVVELSEREAVARWGEDRFIDKYGRIYSVSSGDGAATLSDLPVFYAKDDQALDILHRYWDIEDLLVGVLGIRELVLEERDSWSMVFDNGLLLLVDDLDFTKKLERFMEFYIKYRQSPEPCPLERVDARYDSGLAVKPKTECENLGMG